MVWWLWMVVGCALLLLEMLAPGGFFFLFFGFGALITGLISLLGLVQADWIQIGLFSVISILCLVLFRKKAKSLVCGSDPSKEDLNGLVGMLGTATAEISGGGNGTVEVRGTSWSAKNTGSSAIATGARIKVEAVHGLVLHVKPE